MVHEIFAQYTASISDLKKQPMATYRAAQGQPLAVLNHNEPVFYCIPADLYEAMIDMLDDAALTKLIEERRSERSIAVSVDDL